MKEIKYRAYHSGQMLEVSAIDFKNRTIRVDGPVKIVRWREDNITDNGRINANGGDGTHFSSEMNGELSLDDPMQLPVYLMQYTGLLDRNGTKIFEGDIVEYNSGVQPPTIEQVVWLPEQVAFTTISQRMLNFDGEKVVANGVSFPMKGDILEVIGNIYANPELLK